MSNAVIFTFNDNYLSFSIKSMIKFNSDCPLLVACNRPVVSSVNGSWISSHTHHHTLCMLPFKLCLKGCWKRLDCKLSPNQQKNTCTVCALDCCCDDLVLASSLRYAHLGHPAAGHPAHAGQRAAAVLLCLLYIRHSGRPAVGRPSQKPLLCAGQLPFVSYKFNISLFYQCTCISVWRV